MQYRRLCEGLNDRGKLIPADADISKYVKLGNPFKDVYLSIYKYSDKHKEAFEKTGSVAGITDLTVDKLLFDFDDKESPEKARQDAVALCHRLIEKGIDEEAINAYWSGGKGIHIEVNLAEDLTPEEFKAVTKNLTTGLETYDSVVSNPSRIVRVPGSIHKGTQLYKTRLDLTELDTLSIDEIKVKAKNFIPSIVPNQKIKLPAEIAKLKKFAEKPAEVKTIDAPDLTMEGKPKFLTNCRYALQKGFFGAGERNTALLVLAATYRNQGFDEEHTYRLLKAVAEKQSKRTGQAKFDNTEIWTTIIKVVYSDSWRGGQYTCREPGNWLFDYCQSLGGHKCKHNDDDCFVEIDDFASKFKQFAINIEQNTLKIGVPAIDDKVMITTSMLVGLLGAPSSGKTTLLLNFLEQSNKDQIDSVFFSMDMGLPLVYLRLIQKHFGIKREEVFELFRNNPSKMMQVIETLKESYKLTKFSFRTGLNVETMRNAVLDHQEKTGRKVKLVGIDYLECISGPYSDPTANTGLIANQLKDLANDLDTCVMLLLQTQKQSGDPSEPLLSMRNVKGSSVVEQACSVILTLSRPGFSASEPENDKFATVSTVKDRMGSLMSIDVGWKGLTGSFYDLEDEDYQLLKEIRERKKLAKEAEGGGWG